MASNRIKNTSAITSNALLNGLNGNDTGIIFNQKYLTEFNEGSVIFKTGDEADSIFLIVEGEVKIKFPGNRMFGANITNRYKNDFFGEIEFMENTPRKSSAVANSRCLIYILKKNEIVKEKKIIQNLAAAIKAKEGNIKETPAAQGFSFSEKPVENNPEIFIPPTGETLPGNDLENNIESPVEINPVNVEPGIDGKDFQNEPEDEITGINDESAVENIPAEIENTFEYLPEPESKEPLIEGNNMLEDEALNSENNYEYINEPDSSIGANKESYDETIAQPDEPDAVPPEGISSGSEEPTVKAKMPDKLMAAKAEKFDRLVDFLSRINKSCSKELILENGISCIKYVTGAEFCVIYDVDYGKNEIIAGYNGSGIILPIGGGLAGKAALTGETIIIEDALNSSEFNNELGSIEGVSFRNIIYVPVKDEAGITRMVIEAANINDRITEEAGLTAAAIGNVIYTSVKSIGFFEEQASSGRMDILAKSARFILNDLKTPALLIKHYTDFIKSDSAAGNTEKILNLISSQSDNILSYIEAVLIFAGSKQPREKKREEINALFDYLLILLAEYVDSKKSSLFKKINASGFVFVNRNEIYQALYQAVKNSCDAMPEGGKIYITAAVKEKKLTIEIKDTGIGIPEAVLANIFEPFDNSNNKDKAGLGLALANKLIAGNQGILLIESEFGEGTTVRVHLPLVEE